MNRYTGRVNLGEGGVGKKGAFLVRSPEAAHIAVHPVGREEIHVAVSTRSKHHRMGGVTFHLTGDQIPDDDSPGLAVHDHKVHHFPAGKHLDLPCLDLSHHGMVGPQEQLLAGLAPGIEGSGHLGPSEGPVGEKASVLSCKGNALGHALVNDVVADLRQAVDVCFPGPKVAAL